MPTKSTCRRSREGLTEYLENALPPAKRQGIERHLSRCDACRDYLTQLQHLTRAIRASPPERMPAAMKATLLRAFQASERSQPAGSGSDQ